jgi:thymidylate synthase
MFEFQVSIEKQYLLYLADTLEKGEAHEDRTGVGTRSQFSVDFWHDMAEGFPLLTTKRMPFKKTFRELKWFLSGSTKLSDLHPSTRDWWQHWADEQGDLGPIYGRQLRDARSFRFAESDVEGQGGVHLLSVDQLHKLMYDLEHNPNSRRLIISTWNAVDVDQMQLPCCHGLVTQFRAHNDGRLSLKTFQRSADALLGLPVNFASYGLLLTMIAWAVRRTPGTLNYSVGDFHIYNNHVDQVREQLQRAVRPLPKLRINLDREQFPDAMTALLAIDEEHLELLDYDPHGKITAPLAI